METTIHQVQNCPALCQRLMISTASPKPFIAYQIGKDLLLLGFVCYSYEKMLTFLKSFNNFC